MEEKKDTNPIPPAAPSTLSQTPTPTSETPRIKSKLPIIIAAVMLILVIAGVSAFFIMSKPKPNPQEPITRTQQPTPTPDPTANWKTYTNEYFAFKYPANWVTAKDPEYNGGGTIVYNPLKMKKINEGGPELIEVPEEYLDFISAEISNTTAKQDIDNEAQKWKGIDLNRQSIEKKGIDYELFNSIGGGDAPKDRTVEISNGYVLVKVLSSIMKLDDGRIESQILSTFKFIDSNSVDTSTWKTYNSEKFQYQIKYPSDAKIIKPDYTTIAHSPSDIIIQYNLAGCVKDLANECVDQFDIAVISNQSQSLESFVSDQVTELKDPRCKIDATTAGQLIAIKLTGCVIGTFTYIKTNNYIIKIGYSDDSTANQILSTFKFTQ